MRVKTYDLSTRIIFVHFQTRIIIPVSPGKVKKNICEAKQLLGENIRSLPVKRFEKTFSFTLQQQNYYKITNDPIFKLSTVEKNIQNQAKHPGFFL